MSKIGNINIDVFLTNITLEELEYKEVSVNGSPQYGFIISRKRTPPQEISFLIQFCCSLRVLSKTSSDFCSTSLLNQGSALNGIAGPRSEAY